MPILNKATGDSHSPAHQQKQGSSITDKVGGAVNVIHGTGEVIRGHAMEAGEFGHHGNGDGKAIIAAGREKVQRGLDKIEGKTTATSAAGNAPDQHQSGVGDGTGTAPNRDRTAPQASTVTPHADPTDEKVREDAADTRRPAESGTASAATNGSNRRTPQQHRDEPTAAADDPSIQRDTDSRQRGNRTVPGAFEETAATRGTADASHPANAVGREQRDRPTAADDSSVQRDTNLRQQGNRTGPGDFDEGTAATRGTADASNPANAAGQEKRDRHTAADDPSVQRDTDLRQQGNRTGPGDFDEGTAATRGTADASNPANAAGQEKRDRHTAADDPSVQRDTDLRQQGNGTVPGNFDEETAATRGTADASYPANTVGQEQPPVTASLAY